MNAASLTRRNFLSNSFKAGTIAALGDLAFLDKLTPVALADVKVPAERVRLEADIEPLVRLIEDTDRAKLLDVVAERIRGGTSYQQLLTAVFLAGVRGIQPRPVGFKFHAVLVINSAHLAAMAATDRERWLPLIWAIDNFKASQERNRAEGNWIMPPAATDGLPKSGLAAKRFREAMDKWDESAADHAVVGLVRSAGAAEVSEIFWRYGARDFRDIGHKAIYAANAYRTLQTIGWRHAEPVYRSLAYALLEHEGTSPAERDDERDRPWRENLKRAEEFPCNWKDGKVDAAATKDFLATMRKASPAEACDQVVAVLDKEIHPASLWDGLFLTAGELLMRQPGIVGLHCVTSMNALHFAYQTSGNDETRKMMLLQAAAFLPMFRQNMLSRGKMREDLSLDTLEPAEFAVTGPEAIDAIFKDASKDRIAAARKTLALMNEHPTAAAALLSAARQLIFAKGGDSHDYKFSSAALEDFYHTTPAWRNRYLASAMFNLRGSADKDNDLIKRTRAALAS
jgi:hypothetical protein